MRLSELAQRIGATCTGPADREVTGVNSIQDAGADEVCFLASTRAAAGLAESRAAAVLVGETLADCPLPQLVVDNVNRALIATLELFAPVRRPASGIHPSAVVEADAQVDPSVVVGPHAYVGPGVRVGARTVLGAGCCLHENVTVGADCRLDDHVVVYADSRIGDQCTILANTTIGATGFGYAFFDGQHHLIPHNGRVVLEDGVEIGSNSCVDRAKFGETRIGAGTKIDNLVQIAHNVRLGRLCLVAGQAGLSGSTQVGDGVVFAGRSATGDHARIGDRVVMAGGAVVTGKLEAGHTVLGYPAQDLALEMRCRAAYRRLPELLRELRDLRRRVAALETPAD